MITPSPVQTAPTWKTEIALACAIAVAVIPVVTEYIPRESAWAPILAALLAIATYIGGRQLRTASDNRSNALLAAAQVTASAIGLRAPTEPAPANPR